jgi:hypothetical protein
MRSKCPRVQDLLSNNKDYYFYHYTIRNIIKLKNSVVSYDPHKNYRAISRIV